MVYSHKIIAFFIYATCLIIFLTLGNAVSYARDLESGFCSAPPIIDGRIKPAEWTEAKAITFEMDYYDAGQNVVETHPAKIYIMNDNDNLFIGFTLKQEEYDGTWSEDPNKASMDIFIILFDENDDGVFGKGEDKKILGLIGGESSYSDQHKISDAEEQQGKEEVDRHQDGAGLIRHSNTKGVGDYTAEFRIPLSSGDNSDIDLKPGAKVRWNVVAFDKFGSDIKKLSLGALNGPNIEESSSWGYLTLASGLEKKKSSSETLSRWNSKQEKADSKIESQDGWVRLWYIIKDFFGESSFIYEFPSKPAGKGLVIKARGEGVWMVSLGLRSSIPDELSEIPYFMIEGKKSATDHYLPFSDFGFRSDHAGDFTIPRPDEVKSLIFTPSLGWSEKGQSHFLEIKEIRTYNIGSSSKTDKDGDGIPNSSDYDMDGDGWFNVLEGYAGTDQMDPADYPGGKLVTPSKGSYTGLLVTSGATGIREFESLTGMKPAIIAAFPGWEQNQDARFKMDRPFLEWIWRHGSVPKITWIPEGKVRLQDILDGKHDTMIAALAKEVKALKQPVIWAYGVEVNGSTLEPSNGLWNFGKDGKKKWFEVKDLNSNYGDPKKPDGIERWKDYVSYLRKIFDSHGVNNAVYLFHALMEEYTKSGGGDVTDGKLPIPGDWNTVTNYYPDRTLVDWGGFTSFTIWGDDRWLTLPYVDNKKYWSKLRTANVEKPFMIPEFFIFPPDNSAFFGLIKKSGSRAKIFSKVFGEMKTKYPYIKAWMFANTRAMSPPALPFFPIAPYLGQDSAPDEIEAFKTAVTQDPYFLKNPILFPKRPQRP